MTHIEFDPAIHSTDTDLGSWEKKMLAIQQIAELLFLNWPGFDERTMVSDALRKALQDDEFLWVVQQLEYTKKYATYEGNEDYCFLPYSVTQISGIQERLIQLHGLERQHIHVLLRESRTDVSHIKPADAMFVSLQQTLMKTLSDEQERFKNNGFNDLYQELWMLFGEWKLEECLEVLESDMGLDLKEKSLMLRSSIYSSVSDMSRL